MNREQSIDVEVTLIASSGLGFGEGSISYEARKAELGAEVMDKGLEAAQSPEILQEVSRDKDGKILDDDGCGDGRNVGRIFEGATERFKSLSRAKVFGGGVTMATAAAIGLGRATKNLRNAFSDGLSQLRDKMIGFGAHTDTHAHDGNCGCGAIDKAPRIIQNTVNFREEITGAIDALGIDKTGLDEVFTEFMSYAADMDATSYTGSSVMEEVVENGKVVKELDDNHKEGIVVLNTVEGYTVNQEKVREATDGEVQAFAVDVWRLQEIAGRLHADESEEVRHKAFLSELVYTLATAATLTKGDLPVVVVSKQPEAITA